MPEIVKPGKVDSRVLVTAVGFGGVTKPEMWLDGRHQRVFCANCGKPKGWATVPEDGLDGIIAICDACHEKLGPMSVPLLGHIPDEE